MGSNPILEISSFGQSVWLDYIRRALLTSGELERMVRAGEISGLTSNPAIFEKAIAGSTDYDESLRALLRGAPATDPYQVYEALAIEDIQNAADVLRPVYDETGGVDGYASLEVSPKLARDAEGTVVEARRLFHSVNRPNVMIKVPATPEATPAIASLISEEINVNVTLMFSLEQFEEVVGAYLAGLEKLTASGGDPSKVASVASFFISRIDAAVEKLLPADSPLRGKVAIAYAKSVYVRYRELYDTSRFAALKKQGGRVQRLLWASTGVKNPQYRDVLYMEELMGPDTVMTVPPATLDAFRDHGKPRLSLSENLSEAYEVLGEVEKLGIDMGDLGKQLEEEGVIAFERPFESLMNTLSCKRERLLAGRVRRQEISLGRYEVALSRRLSSWMEADVARRIWNKDGTVWVPDPEMARTTRELTDRLGWLNAPECMEDEIGSLGAFAEGMRKEGISHVVLLGMGGSSLAPEVLMNTFGNAPGFPPLLVVDSTHPGFLNRVRQQIDPARTLFIVSSKSGGTIETISFFEFFYEEVKAARSDPGRNFVAITDPGSGLEALAKEKGLRRVFSSPPEVGGRYSALTYFGLVPAALIGVDLRKLVDRAVTMVQAAYHCVPVADNAPLALGAAMGELAKAGRDKVTLVASRCIASFGAWVEQLIAESTGKNGKGILPVDGETLGPPEVYGNDRLFIYLRVEGQDNEPTDKAISNLQAAGHPVVTIGLEGKEDLGAEFFRWEMATAAAGAVLGINPFDQPDVEAAKVKARDLMKAFDRTGTLPTDTPVHVDDDVEVYGGTGDGAGVAGRLGRFFEQAGAGDYLALMAYVPPNSETDRLLSEIRLALRDRLRLATAVGYGPRLLHSVGQMYKGDGNKGMFIQITNVPEEDVAIPGEPYTFGTLIAAQALGDYQAMVERGRRLMRFHLKADVAAGLERIRAALPSR